MSLTIKPLVWKAAPYETDFQATDHYAVYHVLGRPGHTWLYIIKERSHGIYLYPESMPSDCSDYEGEPFPTVEAAKGAAQAEWNAFIRAAVEETP